MDDFRPSVSFVHRTMEDIRSYEKELHRKEDRLDAFLHSKQIRFALSAGAMLFGALNLIRMASALIFPALCQ